MATLPVPLNVLADEQRVRAEKNVTDRRAGLPVSDPTTSFWLKEPNVTPSPGEGSEGKLTSDADICIIGSGMSGVSVAYHLARLIARYPENNSSLSEPLQVVILDARDFCECLFPVSATSTLNALIQALVLPVGQLYLPWP